MMGSDPLTTPDSRGLTPDERARRLILEAIDDTLVVEAAAGTYSISVQFKNSLGGANVTQVSNRALWVKTETFA